MNYLNKFIVLLIYGFALSGCVSTFEQLQVPDARLREAKPVAKVEAAKESGAEEAVAGRKTPGPSARFQSGIVNPDESSLSQNLPEGTFEGSYNNLSVSAFVNEIFGEQLGLSFSIDPDVQALTDLVTLRLVKEVDAPGLFTIAQETLASYGVTISTSESLYAFSVSEDATAKGVPLVSTGGALPDVPASHRPLFLFVQIEVVNANSLRGWLGNAMRGQELQIDVVAQTNALLLQGKPSVVEQALNIVKVLDQPAMRGQYSMIIEPSFTSGEQLAKDVVEVLRTEGFDAGTRPPSGGVLLLPLSSTNKIIVMASTSEVLDHVISWIELIDRKSTTAVEDGIFIHQIRNTDVEYLVDLLNEMESGKSGSGDTETGGLQSRTRGRFIADINRNAIVFRGSGQDWVELLPAIIEMDQPTPSVLVEVILAEVTLNDQEETGFEFIARSGDVTFSTLGGLGIGANGLTATLNRAGETRAVLNAFYSNDRANIISRPRLMVKSGQQASIDVGNEIPVVTSTSQSTDGGNSPIIQNVSYRNTGVLLTIEPVVHSSGYVDIRISQELSEAQQTSTSTIDSPTIFNRKLETTVTLRDGGSVLLGGLISETSSDSNNGIKGLGRVPGFGALFRKDASTTDKTELVMMVIPYVVENPDEAAEITDKALEFLELTR